MNLAALAECSDLDLLAYEQECAAIARDDFATFYRWAWPIVEPGTPLEWTWHLDALCEHSEAVVRGEIRRLLVEMPPGCMKSMTFGVMLPAWRWVKRPTWRGIFSTHSHDLSKRDSLRRRDIVTDPDFRRLFASGWDVEDTKGHPGDDPRAWSLSEDQAEKVFFRNTLGGHMVALSVKSSVTGHRGDDIMTDDLLDVRRAYSEADRKVAADHVLRVLPSRVNDMRTATWVHVQQRCHEDDPAGVMRDLGFEVLSLPMEADPRRRTVTVIGWQDPRTEPGEILDPVRFPATEIEFLRRTLGTRDFETQFNQSTSPDAGEIIKRAWIEQHAPYQALPAPVAVGGEWWMTVDPKAGSKNPKSAYVVIQVWVRHGAMFWLVDQRRGRWDFPETCREIEAMAKRWPRVTRKLVEAKGDGAALVATLVAMIPGIVPVPVGSSDGEKTERLRAVSPVFEAGQVRIPVEFPSAGPDNTVEGWVHEIVTAGAGAKFMDQADATSQVLNAWLGRAFRRVDGAGSGNKPARPRSTDLDRLRRLSGR